MSEALGEWTEQLLALARPGALIELALVALVLLMAWGALYVMRGDSRKPDSIWFGKRVYDGVLFPMVVLAFALVARFIVAQFQPVAVFRFAVPILWSLVIIRVGVRVLHVAFPKSQLVRLVERTLSWVVWIGLVLWVTGLLPMLLKEMETIRWNAGGTQLTLRSVIEAALSAVVVLVFSLWLSSAIEARLLRADGLRLSPSLRRIAANVTRALIIFVGLLVALSAAGIPLTALSVFGGAFGVGIAFGLQKLASNYVSGFVILAERSLHIGDMVKVDNFEGRITDINTRYTVIRALNGREANVPNEMLITQRVENFSHADSHTSVTTTLQVAYGSSLDALVPRLLEAVNAVERVLDHPAPEVHLSAFGLEGLELSVRFFTRELDIASVKSEVNFAVLRTLDELRIEIPLPRAGVRIGERPAAGEAS